MNPRHLLLTLLCVAGISLGQVLFKLAASAVEPHAGAWTALRQIVLSPLFSAALLLYLGATVLWVWILRSVPLGTAYPFMALAFIAVPLLAALLAGEPLQARVLAGALLIGAGIYVVAR